MTAWADESATAPPLSSSPNPAAAEDGATLWPWTSRAPGSPAAGTRGEQNPAGEIVKSDKNKANASGYVFGEESVHADGNGGISNGSSLLGGLLGKNLSITGGSSLSYRANSISGGRNAQDYYLDEFQNNYDVRRIGPFQNAMDLTIQGKLFNVWNVNAHLTNARYGNFVNQTFGFNYKSKGTSVDIGDVNAALPGNSLVTFSKSLQGLVFGRDFGGGRIRMTNILSLTRAVTRRGSFRGQDSSGPYFLNGGYLLEGSVRLRVDGQEVRPVAATDEAQTGDLVYSIDYYTGQVHFNRIIPSASTVEYSYESRSTNATPGLLMGQRLDFVLGGGNTFGVTWLRQQSTGGLGRSSDTVERFPVVDNINYLYVLSALVDPLFPVEVRWLGQSEPLVENVDYEVLSAQHAIRLKRVLPPDTAITGTASLRIEYRPVRSQAVAGDRTLMGLDGNLRLGGSGNLQLQFGRSQSPDGTGTGTGMTATASLRGGGTGGRNQWTLASTWRDIGSGFSTIDSVGGAFLRAEKGFNTNLTFSPNQYVSLTTALTNSRIALVDYGSLTSTATSAAPTWATNSSWNANLSLTLPHLPTFQLSHNQVTQASGASSRSRFTQTSLDSAWRSGILSLSASLGRTESHGQTVFSGYGAGYGYGGTDGLGSTSLLNDYRNGLYGSAAANDSTSTTSRLGVQLTPAAWVSLTGNIGLGRTKYGAASAGSVSNSSAASRDLNYGITLTPLREASRLTIQATFSDSSNGQSTANFYNPGTSSTTGTGLGTGLTGTGSTTGTGVVNGSFLPATVSGQRTRQRQLSVQYAPWSSLTLNFDLNHSLALIPGYDNTSSDSTQMGFTLTPWSKLQLSGQLLDQKTTYVGNQGSSNSRSYLMAGTMGPFGKLTISASLQRMNTGSALYYGGEIPGIGGTTTGTGLLGGASYAQRQNMTIFATRADYPLGGGRTLFAQWQSLDSRSPAAATSTTTNSAYYTSYNSQRAVGTIGVDFKLTQILGFTVDMNLIRLNDRDNPNYSYQARTMNADLSARF